MDQNNLVLAGAGLLALIVVYLLYTLKKAGLFVQPKVEERVLPKLNVLYKIHHGKFSNCRYAFDEICSVVGMSANYYAVFFDDPYLVATDKLRYAIGVVLDDRISPEEKAALVKKDYKEQTLPSVPCFYTSFPMTGFISVMLSVRRVYKVMYSGPGAKAKCACVELSDGTKSLTEYYLPRPSELTEEQLKVFMLGQEDMEAYAKRFPK